MEGWFPLAEQFHTQADPAFCGLGTLVTVLNALAIDPGRPWMGPWRWYSEALLDCCRPLSSVREKGITLDELVCLARCNGAAGKARRPGDATLEDLRCDVETASRSAHGVHLVASYSRKALGQTGDGHFSPVAGYHPGRDLCLVLDVARFKYPPHWVPLETLWRAMEAPDTATGRPRGWVLLRRGGAPVGALWAVSQARVPWTEAARWLFDALPGALAERDPGSTEEALRALFAEVPEPVAALLALRALDSGEGFPAALRDQAERLGQSLRETALYAALGAVETSPLDRERAAMLVLGLPDSVFGRLAPAVRDALGRLRDPTALPQPLRDEVCFLRTQFEALESHRQGAG